MKNTNTALIFFALFFITINSVVTNEIVHLTDETESNGLPQWSLDGEKLVYVTISDMDDLINSGFLTLMEQVKCYLLQLGKMIRSFHGNLVEIK